MFSAVYDIEKSQYGQYGRYLHEQHFWMTVLVAFLIHVGAAGIYMILPENDVEEIPVKVLNVKLGGVALPEPFLKGEGTGNQPTSAPAKVDLNKITPQKKQAAKPVSKPKKSVREKTPAKPDKKLTPLKEVKIDNKPPVARKAKAKQPLRDAPSVTIQQPPAPAPLSEPKRYVREKAGESVVRARAPTRRMTKGSVLGNSTSDSAEVRTRYTQTLSLWIDKHKIYPAEARAQGQGGQVRLRIRINRQGRIIRYILEQASGYAAIDQAISQMVNAANPVPAVPSNYPDKSPYLEFIIPINFKP